jgi:hypothetical protein
LDEALAGVCDFFAPSRRWTRPTVGAPSLRDKIQRKEIDRENLQGVGHDRGLQANAIGVLFGMKWL